MALRCAIVTKLPYMTEDENSTCNTGQGEPAGHETARDVQGCSRHTALQGQDMLLLNQAHHTEAGKHHGNHTDCGCWCEVFR